MKRLDAHLGRLFRKIEKTVGTGEMSLMIIDAFAESLCCYRNSSWTTFFEAYVDLMFHIENTKPRFSIIIDSFYKIYEAALQSKKKKEKYSEKFMYTAITEIKNTYENAKQAVIENGISLVKNRDTILIYDHSSTVLEILKKAREEKKFEVIIARQDESKTYANIEFCEEQDICFRVIPTYMLSHMEQIISKVFLGCVTLKETNKLIMDPGCMQIVSEFTVSKRPIYSFLTTAKFSLWEDSGAVHDVNIKERKIHHGEKNLAYDFMTFSHDRVNVDLFDKFVTEEGMFTPEQVKQLFQKKFSERKKLSQEMLKSVKGHRKQNAQNQYSNILAASRSESL